MIRRLFAPLLALIGLGAQAPEPEPEMLGTPPPLPLGRLVARSRTGPPARRLYVLPDIGAARVPGFWDVPERDTFPDRYTAALDKRARKAGVRARNEERSRVGRILRREETETRTENGLQDFDEVLHHSRRWRSPDRIWEALWCHTLISYRRAS